MVVYADELREGDFACLDGQVAQLTHVTVAPEVDMVFAVGVDLFSNRVIVPSPFTLANLVEVFDVR